MDVFFFHIDRKNLTVAEAADRADEALKLLEAVEKGGNSGKGK